MISGEQRNPGRLVNTRETGLSSLVFHIVFHVAFCFLIVTNVPYLTFVIEIHYTRHFIGTSVSFFKEKHDLYIAWLRNISIHCDLRLCIMLDLIRILCLAHYWEIKTVIIAWFEYIQHGMYHVVISIVHFCCKRI